MNAIVTEGHRAGDVIQRIRQLATKTDPCRGPLDLNDVIRGVIPLILTEMRHHQVSLRMELAPALPSVLGDRVQVQQVIINLMINGIEAMTPVADRTRELVIRSRPHDGNQVLVTVEDAGIGIDAANIDQPLDHPRAWWAAVGDPEPDARGRLSLQRAGDGDERRGRRSRRPWGANSASKLGTRTQ